VGLFGRGSGAGVAHTKPGRPVRAVSETEPVGKRVAGSFARFGDGGVEVERSAPLADSMAVALRGVGAITTAAVELCKACSGEQMKSGAAQ